MKKRLVILLIAVIAIVLLHSLAMRSCSPIAVTVNQIQTVDTIYIGDTMRRQPRQYAIRKIEINAADSLALLKICGIGPVFAHRILTYRTRLGGFHSTTQLLEIKGINEELIEKFVADSSKIQKINVNFASRSELEQHPYISPSMALRITKSKLKGGYFNNCRELVNQNILLPKEAQQIAPYLSFKNN